MFVMADRRETKLSGEAFAWRLLEEENLVSIPGESFGAEGTGHLRVALPPYEAQIAEVSRLIARLTEQV